MKYFFSEYLSLESLLEQLRDMDFSEEERHHLASLIDSSLHHAILDEVLSNLSEGDKKLFLKMLEEDQEGDKLKEFLESKIDNIEDKIKKVSDDLVEEMHKDIGEASLLQNQKVKKAKLAK